jgi:hypothetical protein
VNAGPLQARRLFSRKLLARNRVVNKKVIVGVIEFVVWAGIIYGVGYLMINGPLHWPTAVR